MDQFGGGNWNMIPTMATHSNPTTPSNQDHLYLQQLQFQQQQQQQQQFHQQQQQFQLQQQQQRYQMPQQPPQPTQPQPQPSQSLASHFHLQNLVENLADAIENGTRDQHFDTLVTELSSRFENCQRLLNTISGSITSKAVTVEGQKHKVEEAEQMLIQRRDLIAKYRNSVEELTKPGL